MFPLTRSKAKSQLPQQENDSEKLFLYVDWTMMYRHDRFFGRVYHKLRGDKPYDSKETVHFKIQGNRFFWKGLIGAADCLIARYGKHGHQYETAHAHSRVLK